MAARSGRPLRKIDLRALQRHLVEIGNLPKEVLDCGAGGAFPPLAVFREHGYETHGIEISPEQLELARGFCRNHGLALDLSLGDMRRLPYRDGTMSFIYSYNSICHMTKRDVGGTMGEIGRVLRPRGLCYVKPGNVTGPENWGLVDGGYYTDCPKLTGAQLLAWEIAQKKAEAHRPGSGSGEAVYATRFEADFALRALRVGLQELKSQAGAPATPSLPASPGVPTPKVPTQLSGISIPTPNGLPSPWLALALVCGVLGFVWFFGRRR